MVMSQTYTETHCFLNNLSVPCHPYACIGLSGRPLHGSHIMDRRRREKLRKKVREKKQEKREKEGELKMQLTTSAQPICNPQWCMFHPALHCAVKCV